MIRPYIDSDKNTLLELITLNIPKYFETSEKEDFNDYLNHQREDYFVLEEDGKIVGSGGINYFLKSNSARISWDIIHPNFHGKGLGKKLTLFRINLLKKNPNIHFVIVRTSQHVFQFYEKMGFELEKVDKNFWAEGFDLYQMRLEFQ